MINKQNKIGILLPGLLLAVIAGFLGQAGCAPFAGPREKITVGAPVHMMSGLLYIAVDRGYDKSLNLEIIISDYPTGRDAARDLRAGRIEVAAPAEFVMVNEIMAGGADLRCLSAICAGEVDLLIARPDRGISRPAHLKGKTIGLARKTQAEFFLSKFLTLNHISLKEVTIVDVNPEKQPDALAHGQVDAVLAFEPNTFRVLNHMERDVVAWPAQGGQDFYFLLVSREGIIKKKTAAMENLLRALVRAAGFYREQPEAAKAIIARWTKIDVANLKSSKLHKRYEVFLDESLLLAMKDQARWMLHNGLTDQKEAPDFRDYLHIETLVKMDPKAVRLAFSGKVPLSD